MRWQRVVECLEAAEGPGGLHRATMLPLWGVVPMTQPQGQNGPRDWRSRLAGGERGGGLCDDFGDNLGDALFSSDHADRLARHH